MVIHYNKTKGDITPFGKTTHYIFQGYFDVPKDDVLVFDSEGNQITENLEDYCRVPGGGKLRVGGGFLSAY